VGAVCPNWARTVLCGGREVTRVPTAIMTLTQIDAAAGLSAPILLFEPLQSGRIGVGRFQPKR
jgi:hypothetical protein